MSLQISLTRIEAGHRHDGEKHAAFTERSAAVPTLEDEAGARYLEPMVLASVEPNPN
jgi:hypothetical protein